MDLFILMEHLQYAKRLVTYLQGKLQGRCVVWIRSWALRIHGNCRTSLGANHLISKGWIEIDDTVLQKMYVIWYKFITLGKSFARPFEVEQLPFHGSCFSWDERHLFLIWNNERFVTILDVWVDITRLLFFHPVSVIKKLDSKFESFLTEELKIPNNNLIQYVYLFILIYRLG